MSSEAFDQIGPLIKQLPGVDLNELLKDEETLDEVLDRLESNHPNTRFDKPEAGPGAKTETAKRQKRRKKRKPRYPKGFDPANPSNPPPDPERWIPKKERAEYIRYLKKTGRYVKKKYDGPQGAMPTVAGESVKTFGQKASSANIDVNAPLPRKHRR
jgi:signal recognition particle subunit SRP72